MDFPQINCDNVYFYRKILFLSKCEIIYGLFVLNKFCTRVGF